MTLLLDKEQLPRMGIMYTLTSNHIDFQTLSLDLVQHPYSQSVGSAMKRIA